MRRVQLLAAIGAVALTTASAWACPGCTAQRDATLPGFWLLSPQSAAALYVLSAFLERPFLTAAGITRHALAHSLVVAAVSMFTLGIAGGFIYFVTWPTGLGLLWMPASLFAAAALKRAILQMRYRIAGPIRFWPIFAGVAFSNIAIALLPLLQIAFGFYRQSHAAKVEAFQPPAALATLALAAIAVIVAFVRTRPDGVQTLGGHGFEVLPAAGG